MRFERRRLAGLLALLLFVAIAVLAATLIAAAGDEERLMPEPAPSPSAPPTQEPSETSSSPEAESPDRSDKGRIYPRIRWRRSIAIGEPTAGRLVKGVRLPSEGRLFFTWDPVRHVAPNRAYRRNATDRLIRTLLRVFRSHARANPGAPRVSVGDLSRPHGGDFGRRFGSPDHESHQNGLDADIYYPRRDGRERQPWRPDQIDRALSQDLVDRFVVAGARFVFVGPNTGLTGPSHIVQPLANHDDHMHVRIPKSN
jgi:murein endopeptidase